ncbi:hypothetical protein M3Y99_00542500 [Aphelenchoides fujianensis]|nr:hypothetical protein M3Y99_00542500 [Aphelenchoides fujianensis]
MRKSDGQSPRFLPLAPADPFSVQILLNFINLSVFKLERLYSVVMTTLFLVATILLVWWHLEFNDQRGRMIGATVLILVEFLLFSYDTKILQGELAN